ncbi:MAG TPA: MFS transporter [Pseudolabrys sp.]|jgi:PPP family 3-phenylpropionic acid transporter
MRLSSQIHDGFAQRLAALYAGLFIVAGIQLPFFPLWLKAKGLDPQMIGLVLAAPIVARMIAVPLVARAADRREALRAAIIATSFLGAAGFLLVGLAEGARAILVAYTLAALALTPVMPLAETYALKGLTARGRAYGPVRLWGSAAFILGTFVAGFVTDTIPARYLIWLIAGASLLSAFTALALAPLTSAPPPSGAPAKPRPHLLRDPAFIAVLAAASLIQASHAVYYGFSALQWRGAGFDGTAIAALWALGVIAEIVLFAVSGRLPPFLQPSVLLMIGAAGGALRWAFMALDPPAFALPWLQLLHAASFGATHLGALGFVARSAPPGQGATAQGYLAIALGVTMAAATGLSGWLYGAFGSRAYAAMALAAIAGGACGYVVDRARRIAGA